MKRWIWNQLLLLDCWVDSFFFGSSPFETMSSRCWRHREHWAANYAYRLIDWLAYHIAGQTQHCQKSEQAAPFYIDYELWK